MVITQEEDISLIKGKRSKRPRPPSPLTLSPVSSRDEEDMAHCLILLATKRDSFYRCKTCDKSFSSFQALGGHRASHAKSADDEDGESTILSLKIPTAGNKAVAVSGRVHECSACGAEFLSGQALGGHMRRHRRRKVLSLDLNLPAPEDNQEQLLVFSTASVVDCHF